MLEKKHEKEEAMAQGMHCITIVIILCINGENASNNNQHYVSTSTHFNLTKPHNYKTPPQSHHWFKSRIVIQICGLHTFSNLISGMEENKSVDASQNYFSVHLSKLLFGFFFLMFHIVKYGVRMLVDPGDMGKAGM
jgi:hypothetical protein